jgi:hypothetical protein
MFICDILFKLVTEDNATRKEGNFLFVLNQQPEHVRDYSLCVSFFKARLFKWAMLAAASCV